jgi:hypothetical protein
MQLPVLLIQVVAAVAAAVMYLDNMAKMAARVES